VPEVKRGKQRPAQEQTHPFRERKLIKAEESNAEAEKKNRAASK